MAAFFVALSIIAISTSHLLLLQSSALVEVRPKDQCADINLSRLEEKR